MQREENRYQRGGSREQNAEIREQKAGQKTKQEAKELQRGWRRL
jgi:hypothetical protein